MRDYMKTVKSLDDNVGRVLDYLKEKGLLDNTLVVYTSDQGFYMGEHGWFDKRFMYEESMRKPLIMRLPKGFVRRGDITEMVQNIDYAPTFLELAGAEIPSDIQGVSLVPLLKGEHPVRSGQDHCIAPEVSAFLLLVLSLPVHIQVVRRGCAFLRISR